MDRSERTNSDQLAGIPRTKGGRRLGKNKTQQVERIQINHVQTENVRKVNTRQKKILLTKVDGRRLKDEREERECEMENEVKWVGVWDMEWDKLGWGGFGWTRGGEK